MVSTRAILAEVMRALAVLALVFLSFAAQPATAAAAGYHTAYASSGFCGGPPSEPGHAPCHACRANPAVLPPAPSVAEPAFTAVSVEPHAMPAQKAASRDRSPANPRAPPASV